MIEFLGWGVDEVGWVVVVKGKLVFVFKVGDVVVWIDFCYFCLVEVDMLFGDLMRVKEWFGWVFEIMV